MENIQLGLLEPAGGESRLNLGKTAERPTAIEGQTEIHETNTDAAFLGFVHLLAVMRIPNYNPCVLSAGRAHPASGTVGKGAQYIVDRIYENQRFVMEDNPD
jgi:hypothetical protein